MRIKQHLPETTFQNKIEAEFSEKENTASNANNKFKNYELEAKTKEMQDEFQRIMAEDYCKKSVPKPKFKYDSTSQQSMPLL